MTFLVHQADGEACTVLCCDIPEGPDRFYHKLFADLQLNLKGDFGWREIQANLLRQVVLEIDHSIWTCSNAIRMLEMVSCNDGNTSLCIDKSPSRIVQTVPKISEAAFGSLTLMIFFATRFTLARHSMLLVKI